jgi:tetratricopeptide (TPR) repeat protein
MNPPEKVPRVFISYSHDSPEYMDQVLALADRLIADGVDCHLDQYETSPPEGWPAWTLDEVEAADFVLVICTETYNLRFRRKEERSKGLGVKWEGAIITQELYDAEANNTRFVPVVFSDEDSAHIPMPLRGATRHRLDEQSGYEDLYRQITNQPRITKPKLGKLRAAPPRERTQEFSRTIADRTAIAWNVPYRRNPFFTGRDQVLTDLHEKLSQDSAAALTQAAAIAGLGGIGKTQTAVEYAYRYRADYTGVFWVRAESESSTISGFIEIARLLDLPEKDAKEVGESVQAVGRWLVSNEGWLLICDNADRPDELKPFLPIDPKGHILITSRAHVFHGVAKPVHLLVLTPEAALEFLLKRVERQNYGVGERESAAELAKELGYLPLALEQAAAFISARSARFQAYLATYRKRRLELLSASKPLLGDYDESVATTWSMNFIEIEQTSAASSDLLRFSAFLDPDGIPLGLIWKSKQELGPRLGAELAGGEDDPLILDGLLEPLTRYSLIQRDTDHESYSIHRMVQEAIKSVMNERDRRAWSERTVLALNAAFPYVDYDKWPLCELLLPHAAVTAKLVDEWDIESGEAGRLLNQIGVYNTARGRYGDAEPLYKRALGVREKALGLDHPDVATSLNNLAELYRTKGKYEDAEPRMSERWASVRMR